MLGAVEGFIAMETRPDIAFVARRDQVLWAIVVAIVIQMMHVQSAALLLLGLSATLATIAIARAYVLTQLARESGPIGGMPLAVDIGMTGGTRNAAVPRPGSGGESGGFPTRIVAKGIQLRGAERSQRGDHRATSTAALYLGKSITCGVPFRANSGLAFCASQRSFADTVMRTLSSWTPAFLTSLPFSEAGLATKLALTVATPDHKDRVAFQTHKRNRGIAGSRDRHTQHYTREQGG